MPCRKEITCNLKKKKIKKSKFQEFMRLGWKNFKSGILLHGIYIIFFPFDNTEEISV